MEKLQRRKFCREFLDKYSENLYPELISKVFEIGLLTLKNSFNKLLFSLEELDNIINDLTEIKDTLPYQTLKKLPTTIRDKGAPLPLPFPKKYSVPTDQEIFGPNQEIDYLPPSKKIIKNYDNTLQNPNFITQNRKIYPNWWWNNKEEHNPDSEDENCPKQYYEYNNLNENNVNEVYYAPEENERKNYPLKKLTLGNKPKYVKKNYYGKNSKSVRGNKNNYVNVRNKNKVKSGNGGNNYTVVEDQYYKTDNNINIPPYAFQKFEEYPNVPRYRYVYVNGKILKVEDLGNQFNTEPNK